MNSLSIEPYLEPIQGDDPCGHCLRYEGEWDRLRELRREDDTSLPSGVWQTDFKRGDWAAVEQVAGELLRERSKDLMIAVWLGEAWIRRYGVAGAASALQLLAGLCERFPDTLHPKPQDDDRSWRVFPLEWMVREYSAALLVRTPLFGTALEEFSNLTLHEWQQLQHRQVQMSESKQDRVAAETARLEHRKVCERLKQVPESYFLTVDANLQLALKALEQLSIWSEGWLAELAPSFSPLRQTLDTLHAQIEEFVPMPESSVSPEPESDAVVSAPIAGPPLASPSRADVPGSREQAYQQLAQIADYLARTEPHSPIPYIIRRAVDWGRQPLSELLNELINADAESRRIWKLLGVLE